MSDYNISLLKTQEILSEQYTRYNLPHISVVYGVNWQTASMLPISMSKIRELYILFWFFFSSGKEWKYFSNEIMGNLILSVMYRKTRSIDKFT
jgi:hypothetical protein